MPRPLEIGHIAVNFRSSDKNLSHFQMTSIVISYVRYHYFFR